MAGLTFDNAHMGSSRSSIILVSFGSAFNSSKLSSSFHPLSFYIRVRNLAAGLMLKMTGKCLLDFNVVTNCDNPSIDHLSVHGFLGCYPGRIIEKIAIAAMILK
jgi:hypothetical protein